MAYSDLLCSSASWCGRPHPTTKFLLLTLILTFSISAYPLYQARDDTGQLIQLSKPATRIISLAPNLTELVFAAGAGSQLVGVSTRSDYPVAAKKIRVVSDHRSIDFETILALHPDLILAWKNGLRPRQIAQLQQLKIPIYYSDPHNIVDVATTIINLGQLADTKATAKKAASKFQQHLAQLKKSYSKQTLLRVFYQVWHQPLFTIGGDSLVTQIIQLCGGINIFAELAQPAPEINLEAVIAANPDVIIGGEDDPNWRQMWLQWPQLQAVRSGAMFTIAPELLQRFGPRLLDGAEILCRDLARARKYRRARPAAP